MIGYVTAFGSQTLHNGTTHHNATGLMNSKSKAVWKPIQLPNGALFDPFTTDSAPQIPQPFKTKITLNYSDASSAETEANAIKALEGERDTVTAVKQSGGNETCTARLTKVDYQPSFPTEGADKQPTLTLYFTPLTAWS